MSVLFFFFFQAEDGIRDLTVTGVQTCALPIYRAEEEQQGQKRGPGCQGMQRRETPGRQRVRHSVRHPASPPCANAVDKRQCELQVSEKVTENPQGVNLEGYEKGWGFRLRGWSGSRRARTRPSPVLRGVGLRE